MSGDNGGYRLCSRALGCNIQFAHLGAAAAIFDLTNNFRCQLCLYVRNNDMRAIPRKPIHRCPPDTTGATSDQHHFAFHAHSQCSLHMVVAVFVVR
jgi:hypothetical protein